MPKVLSRHIRVAIRTLCRQLLHWPALARALSAGKTAIQTGVSTETSLTDPSEGLIRRVRKTPKREYGQILDPITQRSRAPAAAFEPRFYDPNKPDRPVDEALSVNVQS